MPRPLHGLLHSIGVALQDAGRAIVNAVNSIGRSVPGGSTVVWLLLGAALVTLCALISSRYSRRILLERGTEELASRRAAGERAADLERQAERAEREGRLADAVRLRFRAGVARLAERGVIPAARSTPSASIARTLDSQAFDELAHRFDEIVYGGAPARTEDVEQARTEWPLVLRGDERS